MPQAVQECNCCSTGKKLYDLILTILPFFQGLLQLIPVSGVQQFDVLQLISAWSQI